MRVAVLGNSHVAAFKSGWELIGSHYPDAELVFFASPASSMRHLTVDGGVLVPVRDDVREAFKWTSGGLDRIEGTFDAYILVGMSFSFPHLMALMRSHRPPDAYDPDGDAQLVSEAVFESAMRQTLKNSSATRNIENVRKISAAPLIYVPNPYSAETVLTNPAYDYWRHQEARLRVFRFYRNALKMLKRKCIVAEQPPETITRRCFTKAAYSWNAPKLRKAGPANYAENDHGHMNADFGAICLRAILSTHLNLRSTAPAAGETQTV